MSGVLNAAPKETVTVSIEIEERTRYAKRIVMTREQFNDFEKRLSAGSGDGRKAEQEIADYIDRYSDWQSADDPQVEEFEIVETPQPDEDVPQ